MTALCHTETASQKKAQIESGMLNLMRQRPYQEITVTDICREAGIPRRTFYHYFSGKEDVLDTMTETLIQQCFLEGMFDVRLGKAHMEKVFVQIFHFWEGKNREKLDLLIKNGLESRLISWSSLWVRKEQLGYIRKNDMEPQLVEIGLMVGLTGLFSLLFHWSREDMGNLRSRWRNMPSFCCPMLFSMRKRTGRICYFRQIRPVSFFRKVAHMFNSVNCVRNR